MEVKRDENWGLHVEHCMFCDDFRQAETLFEATQAENIRTTICKKCRFVLELFGNQLGTEVLKVAYDDEDSVYTFERLRAVFHAFHLQTMDALRRISSKLPASETLAKMYRQRFSDRNQSE